MSVKLDKIAAELEKARRKRDEWDVRVKELEQKYREQENTEIHDMVHAANLSLEQLAAVLASLRHGTPDMTKLADEQNKEDANYED